MAGKAEYKVQWGTLYEKKYLPLKKRYAALTECALILSTGRRPLIFRVG